MTHVGEEFQFQLVGAPQMIRLFVQLGVKASPIGVLQFSIQLGQLFLALAQLPQRLHQFLVLPLKLLERVFRPLASHFMRHMLQRATLYDLAASLKRFSKPDRGPAAWSRVGPQLIHKPLRADASHPHAGCGPVLAVENRVQIRDAGPLIADADGQDLGRCFPFHQKLDFAPPA